MMIGLRSGLFLAALALGQTFWTTNALSAGCPAFPKVSWWGDLTHASVNDYVGVKYGGDWKPYIEKWTRQQATLRKIQQKGSTAVVRVKTVKSGKIKLRGAMLDSYIVNVEQRLDVMRCLAGQKFREMAANEPSRIVTAHPTPEMAKAKVCIQCHGEDGISTLPTVPNLAGQNELYLVKQLKEFQADPPQNGKANGAEWRSSRYMNTHAKRLNNEEIWKLSAYFSALPSCSLKREAAYTPSRPKIANKCVECHGTGRKESFLETPNLVGQNREYLVSQLNAFQDSGKKRNGELNGSVVKEGRYHYYMSTILKSLESKELEALADYFSGFKC
ncbi:MAG: c-type cytochrome [Rhodospirillales bacterium]|nr:c-type cytochrome [Rhodospirillales bacterium]